MKKFLLSAAATAVASFGIGNAAIIDFEGLVEGTQVLSTDVFGGMVKFTSTDDTLFIAGVGKPVTAFVPNDMPNVPGAFGSLFLGTSFTQVASNLTIEFLTPIKQFSFDMVDIDGPETVVITLLDAMGGTVATETITAGDPGTGDAVVTSVSYNLGTAVTKVVIDGNRGTGAFGIGYDNFEFTAVPVPGALPLFAAGAAGLAAFRRREKRSA
ncbi:MAG: PEP-CTERM sorting domain-containing protein [Pseudomonadota bacterium]